MPVTNERGRVILLMAGLALAARPAHPQSLGFQVVAARFGQSLVGNLIGVGADATIPVRRQSFSVRFGLERLQGGTDRIGTPCTGLIPPGTCLPEPVHDDAHLTSGSIGVVMPVRRWRRIALGVVGDLRLAHVGADTRGKTSGATATAAKTLWGGDLGLTTDWRPSTNVPLGVELGVAFGGLRPVTVTVEEDGYTPFEKPFSFPRLWLGVSWRPAVN
jgi:hypothetical protein